MASTRSPVQDVDMNVLEQVFGSPNSIKKEVPVPAVHMVANEKNNGNGPVVNNNSLKIEDVELMPQTQPLLEADRGKNQPPLAGAEVDDLEAQTTHSSPFPGIDDGLLEPADKRPEITGNNDGADHKSTDGFHPIPHNEHGEHEDGKWPWHADEPDYPYDFHLEGRAGFDDRVGSPVPTIIPDVNTYQQKKNLAQGMMDLALLSANANQLRYVLEASSSVHPYYYSSIIFITLSIILQIGVGIGLILNSRYNVKDEKDICKADKINNLTVLGIFLITIVNVFIASFSVAPTNTGVATTQQAG